MNKCCAKREFDDTGTKCRHCSSWMPKRANAGARGWQQTVVRFSPVQHDALSRIAVKEGLSVPALVKKLAIKATLKVV